ncbi:hypothetical protein F4779DRAFT_637798 [Xylariaceae sp. FL0662B]|nr:hypothetical protein F4779DRAFT_637798 [Xylariaceae sp. FL0662B]
MQRLQNLWTEAWREAVADLRLVRWSRGILGCLFICWIAGLLYVICIATDSLSDGFSNLTACRSGDNFSPFWDGYDLLAPSGFFQITLKFGNFTFTQAKVIDIIWDIVIGRGGQAILAWISWRVFRNYVTTSILSTPITFATFFIVFLQQEPSILSIIRVIRDFSCRRGLVSKTAMTFMASSMILTLGWSTLAGSMSGYTTVNESFVRDPDGNFVPFYRFQPLAYVIHDGWRIGLSGDQPVPSTNFSDPHDHLLYQGETEPLGGDCATYHDVINAACLLPYNVSDYVSIYGFYGLNQTKSTWMNVTLESPALNISAFYLRPESFLFGNSWLDPTTNQHPFQNSSRLAYTALNETYNLEYIQANGNCAPAQNGFQWGVSSIQFTIVSILLLVWTAGTYIMWLKAHFKLSLLDKPEVPKGWKCVLLLAKAMNDEFDNASIDPKALTDKELKKAVNKQLQGGYVPLETASEGISYSFRRQFPKWLAREKYWCIALGTSVVLQLLSLFCGISFALAVGNTTKSRLLLITCWLVLGLIPSIFLIVYYK